MIICYPNYWNYPNCYYRYVDPSAFAPKSISEDVTNKDTSPVKKKTTDSEIADVLNQKAIETHSNMNKKPGKKR